MLVLLLTDRSSASAINQACNTPLRQSKAKMLYVFFLLSALFALIKFHKLYAKHYSVSPHSEESERVGWGGYSLLILRLRPLLVFFYATFNTFAQIFIAKTPLSLSL